MLTEEEKKEHFRIVSKRPCKKCVHYMESNSLLFKCNTRECNYDHSEFKKRRE